ncbi:hypothetical protein TSAR_005487 [Trichomalopsis sarcophagae]|uniref:Uncharacterized protein n=1 Tax=Trichomalopsis sarcophagae TaxID=543379 RepID=A0A232EQS2_9HYME|nr:hypothetical protein TSAR_005487 [Trichomalopsis sarcophagae]
MSVKSAVLKQLEEKCALLTSRMERASRLIQQHRNTYAKVYEDCEEVKSALQNLQNSPSVGPVNLYKAKKGDICEKCARIMQRTTKRTQSSFCTECTGAEDAAMDIVKKDEDIDVGEEFLEYFSPVSPDTAYDRGEIVKIEPGHEEGTKIESKQV